MIKAQLRSTHATFRARPTGFSLVELLVVIAIISIVVAVGFAGMARARESGRISVSIDNDRQLGMALMQYAQNNTDNYANADAGKGGVNRPGAWIYFKSYDDIGTTTRFDPTRGSLYAYVKNTQIYVCPDDLVAHTTGNSYAYNSCLTNRLPREIAPHGGLFSGKPVSHFTSPATTLAFGEEDAGVELDGHSTNDGLMNFPLDGLGYATRHDGGSNVCLLDGHVRRYPYEKLIALDLEEALGDTPCDP